jgi:clan AA aspartic protease
MITGRIEGDEGRIRIVVRGRGGREREIEAVVDTGYTGLLTLHASDVATLGLQIRSMSRATLADGTSCLFAVYKGAQVLWDGNMRQVLVDQLDGDALVGMKLLRGYELRMQVRPRGRLTIKSLPTRSKRSGV